MNTPAATERPFPLSSPPPDGREVVRINEKVFVEEVDGFCVVWVGLAPWHRFVATSTPDRRVVGANLVLAGLAKPADVVRGLGIKRDTLHRDRKRLLEGGLKELANLRPGPQGPSKATPAVQARARRYYREGLSNSEIGRRFGLTEGTVRRILAGEAPREPSRVQLPFFPKEA